MTLQDFSKKTFSSLKIFALIHNLNGLPGSKKSISLPITRWINTSKSSKGKTTMRIAQELARQLGEVRYWSWWIVDW